MAPKPLWHVFKVMCHNHVTPFALCLKSHTWAREEKLLSPTSESHLALDCIKRPDQKAFQISGGGGVVSNQRKAVDCVEQVRYSSASSLLSDGASGRAPPSREGDTGPQGKPNRTQSSEAPPASHVPTLPKTLELRVI